MDKSRSGYLLKLFANIASTITHGKIITMKSFVYASLIGLIIMSSSAFTLPESKKASPQEELKWHTKLTEAQAESQKTKKPIFAFFTGSDWCGWCMRLQANVFRKPGFAEWANENVVLLELDFPRRKQLPPDIAQQNRELQAFFKPRGYPTVWIFTMTPNQETKQMEVAAYGSLGYPSGANGKEEETFIANANRILANGKQGG